MVTYKQIYKSSLLNLFSVVYMYIQNKHVEQQNKQKSQKVDRELRKMSKDTLEKRQHLQKIGLGKLDTYLYVNENRPVSVTPHKN